MFLNLLTNASWATRRKESRRIYIEFQTDSTGHTILFSDNGSGIAAGLADKIFLPFFTSKGPTGIGLGLTIVRDTVRKYGGDVSVQSPGKLGGATFHITLPIAGK